MANAHDLPPSRSIRNATYVVFAVAVVAGLIVYRSESFQQLRAGLGLLELRPWQIAAVIGLAIVLYAFVERLWPTGVRKSTPQKLIAFPAFLVALWVFMQLATWLVSS